MNGKLIVPESVILNLEFEYAKELRRVLSVILVEDEHVDFLSISNYDTVSKLLAVLEANIKTTDSATDTNVGGKKKEGAEE